MKRVLVLLLTAVVMFAFAGCGSEVTDDAQMKQLKKALHIRIFLMNIRNR